MKRAWVLVLIAASGMVGATTPAHAQTARVKARLKNIEEKSVAVERASEEDPLFGEAGGRPSANPCVPTVPTNVPVARAGGALVFCFVNSPLPLVAQTYADWIGKKVLVTDGLKESISCGTTGLVTKAEAAARVTRALEAQGLQVRSVDAGTVRIERKK